MAQFEHWLSASDLRGSIVAASIMANEQANQGSYQTSTSSPSVRRNWPPAIVAGGQSHCDAADNKLRVVTHGGNEFLEQITRLVPVLAEFR